MDKHKAQIARETINIAPEFPGPPSESEFGFALVMCVWAHNLLRPPPPKKKKEILAPPCCTTFVSIQLRGSVQYSANPHFDEN